MEYKIEKLSDLGIIVVNGTGPVSQEVRKETYLKAVYALESSGFHKLLVDVTNSTLINNNKSRTINTLDMVMFMYMKKVRGKR